MSKAEQKITTFTERHEFYVLRRRSRFELYCEECEAVIDFVGLEDAVLYSHIPTREIVRMTSAGEVHFLETVGGQLFLCRRSLLDKMPAEIAALL
jgi:hypothetical protein